MSGRERENGGECMGQEKVRYERLGREKERGRESGQRKWARKREG